MTPRNNKRKFAENSFAENFRQSPIVLNTKTSVSMFKLFILLLNPHKIFLKTIVFDQLTIDSKSEKSFFQTAFMEAGSDQANIVHGL